MDMASPLNRDEGEGWTDDVQRPDFIDEGMMDAPGVSIPGSDTEDESNLSVQESRLRHSLQSRSFGTENSSIDEALRHQTRSTTQRSFTDQSADILAARGGVVTVAPPPMKPTKKPLLPSPSSPPRFTASQKGKGVGLPEKPAPSKPIKQKPVVLPEIMYPRNTGLAKRTTKTETAKAQAHRVEGNVVLVSARVNSVDSEVQRLRADLRNLRDCVPSSLALPGNTTLPVPSVPPTHSVLHVSPPTATSASSPLAHLPSTLPVASSSAMTSRSPWPLPAKPPSPSLPSSSAPPSCSSPVSTPSLLSRLHSHPHQRSPPASLLGKRPLPADFMVTPATKQQHLDPKFVYSAILEAPLSVPSFPSTSQNLFLIFDSWCSLFHAWAPPETVLPTPFFMTRLSQSNDDVRRLRLSFSRWKLETFLSSWDKYHACIPGLEHLEVRRESPS